MIEYRYLLFQITSKYWRIGLSKVGRKENSEIAGGWDCIIWISDRGEVIKGRTREPKRRRGEGGGLYCNGPGYKTAGCKAGRAVVKQLREPVHRGSRSRRPAILSFSASHAASHERPDLNDHRMLAPLGFYRPAKPLLLPRVREGSFVLRSSLFLSNRSRSRSAFLVYPNSNIPFFHPTEARVLSRESLANFS